MEGILYGDLFFEKSEFLNLVLEPKGIEEVSSGKEEGLSLRYLDKNLKNNLSYTTKDFDNFIYSQAFKLFSKEVLASFAKDHLPSLLKKGETFDLDFILGFLEELRKRIPKNPEIRHYRISFFEERKKLLILKGDLEGRFNKDFRDIPIFTERNYFRLGVLVVAEREGRLERGYEVKGYTLPLEKVLEVNSEIFEIAERASLLAKNLLSARKAPPGVMPVVLAGSAGGTMIHEAVGHGLEADHAEEGLSIYSGRIGEKVANENITVLDDPTLPYLYGSYEIDDEGYPAQRVVLIEKGILKNFLYDVFTALKFEKEPNGHGRREDFRSIPLPRMANTFIAKGPHKTEEILKSIDKGLLVKKMGGGEVNPLTGDFVFEVREGYYLEKGEILYPVKGATLVGNGPKVLELIDMVGGDLHFEAGTCGKDGQGVPVSDGQPTLRIPEITVGGLLE